MWHSLRQSWEIGVVHIGDVILNLPHVCVKLCSQEGMTCIVLGDAGKLLEQEALQVGCGAAGSQALHKLQVHRGWMMLHLLHTEKPGCQNGIQPTAKYEQLEAVAVLKIWFEDVLQCKFTH